jgi:hypothetical protein
MIKGGLLTVGYPSVCNLMRFYFGIVIAPFPWLAEERIGPVNRAKAE